MPRFLRRCIGAVSNTAFAREWSNGLAQRSYTTGSSTAKTPLSEAFILVRRPFIWIAIFSFFINILMLVGPFYMLQVYDRVLSSGSYETLLYLTVLAVVLLAFNSFLELVRSRLLIRTGTLFDDCLIKTVFRSLFYQTAGPSESHDEGTQPLRDLAKVRGFLSGQGPTAFFDAPWTPLFILLIFLFHPVLGLIALAGGIVLFLLAIISEISTRRTMGDAANVSGHASHFAGAASQNAEVVRCMGMVPQISQRWGLLYNDGISKHNMAADRIGFLNACSKFVRPSMQVAMLGTGAYLVLLGETTAGVMIAASIVMGRALAPIELAINHWRSFLETRNALKRLKERFDTHHMPSAAITLPRPDGQLSVSSIGLVADRHEKPLLRNISFELAPGDVLAIIGPSASGKSCLAKCLVGVWDVSVGKIRLDGADLKKWPSEDLGPYVGYLPQDVDLFDGTVAENIARFNALDSEAVLQASKMAGSHDMILHLPGGYDTIIGPNGSAISGGQRQRIGLARALYGNPSLIVLDEPNANLDSDGEQALTRAIDYLREQGTTVIVISHRSNILTVVDKVLVLRGGTVEAFDERDKLMPRLMGKVAPIRIAKNVQSEEKVEAAHAQRS